MTKDEKDLLHYQIVEAIGGILDTSWTMEQEAAAAAKVKELLDAGVHVELRGAKGDENQHLQMCYRFIIAFVRKYGSWVQQPGTNDPGGWKVKMKPADFQCEDTNLRIETDPKTGVFTLRIAEPPAEFLGDPPPPSALSKLSPPQEDGDSVP